MDHQQSTYTVQLSKTTALKVFGICYWKKDMYIH